MEFKKYNKILSYLNLEGEIRAEAVNCLKGYTVVEEKIDGANLSIYLKNGRIQLASRNQEVDSFRGAEDLLFEEGVINFLKDYPNRRLYGERLIKNAILYNPDSYNKFYLFDIEENNKFLTNEEVRKIARDYGFNTPHLFLAKENPTLEEVEAFVGKSALGKEGEGVVIKNLNNINEYKELSYIKILAPKYEEIKYEPKPERQRPENKLLNCITEARLTKILNKLEETPTKKDTAKIIGLYIRDIFEEELSFITKQKIFDFDLFRKEAAPLIRDLYFNYIGI